MPTYLLTIHNADGAERPSPEEEQAQFDTVGVFNAKLVDEGTWVFGGGLLPVDTATVVDASKGGGTITTDGPFVEAKEHIGGFWVLKAPDLAAAQALAAEASAACGGPVEVRVFDAHSDVDG